MREQEGRINYKEGLALGFAVLSTKALTGFPTSLIEAGATAAWQVEVVAVLAALVAFWPAALLMKRFPGIGLGAMAQEAAGWFGSLLALGLAAYLTVLGALVTRNVAEAFIVAILPETPPSVLNLGFVICAAAASYKGIETLGRSALIFLPLGVLLAAGLVLLNWNHLHWAWLYPIWGYGHTTTIASGLMYAGAFGEVITILACAYAFRTPTAGIRAGRHAILLAGLTVAVVTVAFLAIFGYQAALHQPLPTYMLAQHIYVGRFFQRVESVFVLIGFFSAAVTLSLLYHSVISITTEVLRLPYHRPLIYPLAVIWFTGAMMPEDYRTLLLSISWMRSWGGALTFGIPLLLLLIAVIRGKGRSESRVA